MNHCIASGLMKLKTLCSEFGQERELLHHYSTHTRDEMHIGGNVVHSGSVY